MTHENGTGVSHTTQHNIINYYISPSRMERGKVVYRTGVTYLPTCLSVSRYEDYLYQSLKRSLPSLGARGMSEW